MCCDHRGHLLGTNLVLFLPCACVLPQRWVNFRVVTGKLNYYLALLALLALLASAQPLVTNSVQSSLQSHSYDGLRLVLWRPCGHILHVIITKPCNIHPVIPRTIRRNRTLAPVEFVVMDAAHIQ